MPASPFHADLCLTQHGQQTMLFNSFKNRICQDPHEDPSPLPPPSRQAKACFFKGFENRICRDAMGPLSSLHITFRCSPHACFSEVSRTESARTFMRTPVHTSPFDAQLCIPTPASKPLLSRFKNNICPEPHKGLRLHLLMLTQSQPGKPHDMGLVPPHPL